MFDKFGEFNSAEELNKAAEGLKEEGDTKSLLELAKENGIDEEDAQDYIDGCVDELCNERMAALGKLKVEREDLKITGVLSDWVNELLGMCTESEEFCKAVRKKGKDLVGYIALTAEKGYENRAVVDRRIVEKTKKIKNTIGNHEFSIGIPDRKTRRELAEAYYLR